jgi:uncharacterized protein
MRIFQLLIAAVLLTGFGTHVRADNAPSPEALQAANELFTIVSGDTLKQLTTQITNAFWPSVEQSARAEKIDDATIAEMRKEFDRLELTFVTDVLKAAPAIYARHFTVDELHELTAFYRTAIGSKALHEMPVVMGEFTATLVPRLQEIQVKATESFDKILREHGYKK